jgi:hypothetical protein
MTISHSIGVPTELIPYLDAALTRVRVKDTFSSLDIMDFLCEIMGGPFSPSLADVYIDDIEMTLEYDFNRYSFNSGKVSVMLEEVDEGLVLSDFGEKFRRML